MTKKRDIKHKRLKQIVHDYNEIQSWLEKHRKRLEFLKKDHELLTSESPYKINFAVDFHEIYRIVFPLGSENEIKKIKKSEKDSWIHNKVVSQTGRICLFYENETVPVLLPPYRDELEDFLFWLKTEYTKAYQQYQVILELRESIQTALHEKISKKDYAKIIKFIKNYFFQLSILLMHGYEEKLSILKSLLLEKRIEMASSRWNDYSGFINSEIKEAPDAWYGFIRKFRKRKTDSNKRERNIERANLRDLSAIHLIKALNKKFKAENKREIVLLVSDAEIFNSLLNSTVEDDINDKTISGVVKTATGEEITICRNTDIFHTYLLVKKEREELRDQYKQDCSAIPNTQINCVTLVNVEDDLRKIKLIEEFDSEIDIIIEFCNKREHDCQDQDNCPKEDICYKTDKVIKKFQEDRKSLESLALAEKFDIFTKIYKRYQQVADINEGAKQILTLLQQQDKNICKKISEKLEKIREHINRGFEKLADNSIIREPEPDVLKIPRGNSFRIRTDDKEVDKIIRKIQKSIRQNSQEDFSHYFSDLKNKKERLDKTKSLKYLSSSLFAAAYEKYDLALYFLETGLIFEGERAPLYRELKYLETIIYCNKKKYEKALTLCNELLKNYQDDCRFPYFCGYIIMTGKEDNELEEYKYEEAVGHCRNALFMVKETGNDDVDLKQALLNNLIYGLAKIDTLEALEEAEQNIAKLIRGSNPEYDWGVDIWHTVGYVYYRKAKLMKGKNKEYSQIKDKAVYYFEIADKKARGENFIIEKDLKKAREL
jgi:hypothetical protein